MATLSVIRSNPIACDCCDKPLAGPQLGNYSWRERQFGFASLPFVTCAECADRDMEAFNNGSREGRIDSVIAALKRASRQSKAWGKTCERMFFAEVNS